jgi:hypothetical protein
MGMLAVSFVLASSIPGFSQTYHISDRWTIGAGGWDYLVADGPRIGSMLPITPRRSAKYDYWKGLGAVTGMKSTHGVADPDGKTGYISDGAETPL